jgi:hypothetical protein
MFPGSHTPVIIVSVLQALDMGNNNRYMKRCIAADHHRKIGSILSAADVRQTTNFVLAV